MADALLTTLTNSAQIQAVKTGAATQDATKVPTNLDNLPVGSLIKGFVINRDAQNNPVLRTQHGDVLVKSDVFLKTGSEVVIRVDTLAQQVRARIITVDSVPIKDVLAIQQQQAQVKQDTVMQSSIAPRQPLQAAAQSTAVMTPFILEGIMLKPASTIEQSVQMLSSIFNLPKPVAQAIAEGSSIQFRIVSGDFQTIAKPSATVPNAPAVTQSSTAAITTMPPVVQASHYQAYGQQSLAPQTPPVIPGNAPPVATVPASPAQPIPAMPVPPALQPAANAPVSIASTQILPQPPNPAVPVPPAPPQAATAPPVNATPPQAATPPATVPAGNATAPIPAPVTVPQQPYIPAAQPAPPPPATVAAMPKDNPAVYHAHTMTARVVGTEAGGETIVRTPVGVFKLFTAAPPPPGSTLQLELVASSAATRSEMLPHASLTAPKPGFSPLSHEWKSLQESAALLRGDPLPLAHLQQRIPNIKSEFINNTLFFLSALKGGGLGSWLGVSTTNRLAERSPALLQRLSADFSSISTLSTDQPDRPWLVYMIPVRYDEELQQARLYIRKDQSKESKDNKNKGGTRFVLEVCLSELGDMQFDGLVRSQEKTLLFDLVIRTEKALDDKLEDDINHLFAQGAEVAGYAGHVRFQQGRDRFIFPFENNNETTGSEPHSIIV